MGRRDTKHFPAQTKQIVFTLTDWVLKTGSPLIWIGRAYQSGSAEHGTGRAVDFILSTKVGIMPTLAQKTAGDQLVAWLIRHADALHVRHIIWQNRIWKTRYASQGWQPLPGNRAGISDAHWDHVHVLLQDASGTVPADPITTPTADWSILMTAPLPQPIRADMQRIAESAVNAQKDVIAERVTERLLGSWLGTSGPSVAVALQDSVHVGRANSKRLDDIEQRLAALEGRE